MKAFNYSILILFLNFFCLYSNAQNAIENERVPFKEIDEIIELYKEGLYNVIKSKLQNRGYKIKNEVPDYTLNKLSYSGQFDFEKDILFSKEYDLSLTSFYKFKKIEYSNSATEYLIEIAIYSKDSYHVFHYLKDNWIRSEKYIEYEPKWCSEECFALGYIREVYCITEENFTPDFELNPYGLVLWQISMSPKTKEGEKKREFFVGKNKEIEMLNLGLGSDGTAFSGNYYFRKLNNKIDDIEAFLNIK